MSGIPDLHRRAVDEFDQRVRAIGEDQWDNPTPCSDWSVRELVNHLVNEDRWTPELFAGKTVEEVGDKYDGDLLGSDPLAAWEEASKEAVNAVQEEGAMERTVHVSWGEIPATEYTMQLLNDHVVHGWDLARAIGAREEMDPELVDALWNWAKPQEEILRKSGAFGDDVEVPEDADLQTKLLALMGRRA